MKNVPILILGRTNNDIGNILEMLVKELLSKAGFGNFIRNAYKTGVEIDIQAKHRVTQTPIIVECKAKKNPIQTPALSKFYGQWEKERSNDPLLTGLMISTSGFCGTTLQWHKELPSDKKRLFKIMGPKDILSELCETKLSFPPEAIEKISSKKWTIGVPDVKWLSVSQHGFTWIVNFKIDDKPVFHAFVDGEGEPIPEWKILEIETLNKGRLFETSLIGLDLRKKIVLALLKSDTCSKRKLADLIQESEIDISSALAHMEKEGIVIIESYSKGDNPKVKFSQDIVAFINLAKEVLSTEHAITFLSSKYAKEVIKSKNLLIYIDNRFSLNMHQEQLSVLSSLLSISPSSLEFALFNDPERWNRVAKEINEKIKNNIERENWLSIHRLSLIQKLIFLTIHDLVGSENSLTPLLSDLGFCRYRLQGRIDATGANRQRLTVQGELLAAIAPVLAPVNGKIEAGSLLVAEDPIEFHVSSGLFFTEIGEPVRAIPIFEKAIELCRKGVGDKKKFLVVINNLALVHMEKSEWNKALGYLEEAPESKEIEFAHIQVKKAECLFQIDKKDHANLIITNLAKLFPEIVENQFFISLKDRLKNIKKSDPKNDLDFS